MHLSLHCGTKNVANMKKLNLLLIFFASALAMNGQTLEECQRAAEQNYPVIKQYDLIAKTRDLTIANIDRKTWLPQITASAQGTYQSDVASWPDEMGVMMKQLGVNMRGLSKAQYRMGIDLNQTLYDGGSSSAAKALAREQSQVESAQTDVTLYNIRSRVNEIYFGLLLIDERIALSSNRDNLLKNSEDKLASMYKHGTASASEYNLIKAERLSAAQQLTSLQAQKQSLSKMLGLLCGITIDNLVKPDDVAISSQATNQRPELQLIDAQMRLIDAQEKQLGTQLIPKVNLFAQGYYGYPGLNMFQDMMKRTPTLNGIVGLKMTWNMGALYTRHNDKAKLRLQRASLENNRETFLFNNRLELAGMDEDVKLYRNLMKQDEEIIGLRTDVRKAAESRLAHGIIDVNDLIKEINNEHAARISQSTHEIEMLKRIYDIKNSINN